MRVVFMGTPDFAVGTLDAIIRAGHKVEAVITQPDKPHGRSGKLVFPPVKEKALEYNIPVYQPVKLRQSDVIDKLKEINPDVIVVVAFGQILPKSVLELPRYGCVNVRQRSFRCQNTDASMCMHRCFPNTEVRLRYSGRLSTEMKKAA